MKRILMAGAVALLSLGATRVALANTALELVTGTGKTQDIIYYNGTSVTCSIGGVASAADCVAFGESNASSSTTNGVQKLSIQATKFGKWNVSESGDSISPSCNANGVCEDQNQVNAINSAGAAVLNAYFASSGFATAGPLLFSESATQLDGKATATAYAYKPNGALDLSGTASPTLPAAFSTLSVTGAGLVNKSAGPGSGAAPPSPYNLATGFSFAVGKTNAGYSVTETIATASVPESSSVAVFLMMLFGMVFVVRGRVKSAQA